MNVTIRDVAKATGVSTATVSNVLNKTGKVGSHTRRIVLTAVRRMGYIPDVHARHLASRERRTLGIIVSDIENPFFPEVVKGFETRARQLGYDVILSDTNYDPRRTREAADRMMEHKVRGVAVMTSEISIKLINQLARRRIAVTFLDLAPPRKHISNLRIDYASGIKQIVEHLYAHGHRKIAFVAGRPNLKSNVARLEAYQNSMRKLGLEPGPILAGRPALRRRPRRRYQHRQSFFAADRCCRRERSHCDRSRERITEIWLPRPRRYFRHRLR